MEVTQTNEPEFIKKGYNDPYDLLKDIHETIIKHEQVKGNRLYNYNAKILINSHFKDMLINEVVKNVNSSGKTVNKLWGLPLEFVDGVDYDFSIVF